MSTLATKNRSGGKGKNMTKPSKAISQRYISLLGAYRYIKTGDKNQLGYYGLYVDEIADKGVTTIL